MCSYAAGQVENAHLGCCELEKNGLKKIVEKTPPSLFTGFESLTLYLFVYIQKTKVKELCHSLVAVVENSIRSVALLLLLLLLLLHRHHHHHLPP